jgi:hypothetical protein
LSPQFATFSSLDLILTDEDGLADLLCGSLAAITLDFPSVFSDDTS